MMFKKIITVEYIHIERNILGNKIKLSLNLNFKFKKEKLGSISFLVYYISLKNNEHDFHFILNYCYFI